MCTHAQEVEPKARTRQLLPRLLRCLLSPCMPLIGPERVKCRQQGTIRVQHPRPHLLLAPKLWEADVERLAALPATHIHKLGAVHVKSDADTAALLAAQPGAHLLLAPKLWEAVVERLAAPLSSNSMWCMPFQMQMQMQLPQLAWSQ